VPRDLRRATRTESTIRTPYAIEHVHHGRAEAEAIVDQRGLVERARRGDHDAFTELARDAVTRLDRVARLILRDPELARDAVQEALIRAWHDLPGLRDPDRFDAWLHRLTVNACLDLARRRRRRVIEVELDSIDSPIVNDHAGSLADREIVDAAMRRLDEHGRAIVVLHYFIGMPLTEVATTLGVPIGTVKSRLHRALGEMRTSVETDPTPASPVPGGQVA
jgi:RNA polymerase sigma-70 factor (ECF subfamily)